MPDLRSRAPWEQERPGVPEDRDGGDIRRLPVGACAHEEVRRTAARSATRLRREIAAPQLQIARDDAIPHEAQLCAPLPYQSTAHLVRVRLMRLLDALVRTSERD